MDSLFTLLKAKLYDKLSVEQESLLVEWARQNYAKSKNQAGNKTGKGASPNCRVSKDGKTIKNKQKRPKKRHHDCLTRTYRANIVDKVLAGHQIYAENQLGIVEFISSEESKPLQGMTSLCKAYHTLKSTTVKDVVNLVLKRIAEMTVYQIHGANTKDWLPIANTIKYNAAKAEDVAKDLKLAAEAGAKWSYIKANYEGGCGLLLLLKHRQTWKDASIQTCKEAIDDMFLKHPDMSSEAIRWTRPVEEVIKHFQKDMSFCEEPQIAFDEHDPEALTSTSVGLGKNADNLETQSAPSVSNDGLEQLPPPFDVSELELTGVGDFDMLDSIDYSDFLGGNHWEHHPPVS